MLSIRRPPARAHFSDLPRISGGGGGIFGNDGINAARRLTLTLTLTLIGIFGIDGINAARRLPHIEYPFLVRDRRRHHHARGLAGRFSVVLFLVTLT